MFSKQANYSKLKTNLRLVINRLKLLEKKKTELALKARKEIADYIQAGKDDRARIRVEHIIREDYLVEAMEMIEMYCDLLLARFGLISSQKELDPGLEEAVATLIWVTPRLQADVAEFKSVAEQLTLKYSKEFAQACLTNQMSNVSEKVLHKLSVQAPPKLLVERYLIEIAKSFGVAFTPDPDVMREEEEGAANLIDMGFDGRKGGTGGGGSGGGSGGGGGGGLPSVPVMPYPMQPGFPQPNYLQHPTSGSVGSAASAPSAAAAAASGYPIDGASGAGSAPRGGGFEPPPYQQEAPITSKTGPPPGVLTLPDLPAVPNSPAGSFHPSQPQPPPPSGGPGAGAGGAPGGGSEDVDFDDLTRRFEDLKRRK